jgi:hypothetical protein
MKRLLFALAIVSPLISCLGGTIETETPGTPKIESFRIVGYDRLSEQYIEKYTFHNAWDNIDWPYLEFTVFDDDIYINEITITLYNDAYPDGKKDSSSQLYQYTNPQLCRCLIPVTQNAMTSQDNLWYVRFFVTDKNGKRSRTHTSDTFTVLSY